MCYLILQVDAGYDGTWVAHPDLVKLAKDIFVKGLDGKDNQVQRFVISVLSLYFALHQVTVGRNFRQFLISRDERYGHFSSINFRELDRNSERILKVIAIASTRYFNVTLFLRVIFSLASYLFISSLARIIIRLIQYYYHYRTFEDLNITENDLINISVEDGKITEGGVRTNVSIALQYLNQWFKV